MPETQTQTQTYTFSVGTINFADFCNCPNPCAACCGITTPCCPVNSIPTTVFATLSDNTGCGCVTGTVITLTWNSVHSAWEGSGTMSGCTAAGPVTLKWYCSGSSAGCVHMLLDVTACVTTTIGASNSGVCSCSPLLMEYGPIGVGAGCCNTPGPDAMNVTITA